MRLNDVQDAIEFALSSEELPTSVALKLSEALNFIRDASNSTIFNKEQIGKGLERAKDIYEGWKLEKLDLEQLYEAIVQANQ